MGRDEGSGHQVYAGKAPGGLVGRLKQHASDPKKSWVDRAILVAELNPNGFTSTEVGWLESELVRTLKTAPKVTSRNENQPVDNTLPAYEQASLRPVIRTVMSVLRLIGVNPDTPDQVEASVPKKKLKAVPGSIKDLIDAGYLEPGSIVSCTWQNRAELNEQAIIEPDGSLRIGDEMFNSPSAAAEFCRGGKANGWTFGGSLIHDGGLAWTTFDQSWNDQVVATNI